MADQFSQHINKNNKRLLVILSLCAVGMFGFGYALVPLYNVMCKSLGLNGKTGGESALSTTIDNSRTITVQFLATNNTSLPWQFYPETKYVRVHPGENTRIAYFAENDSDKTMVVQAIPSVAPGSAAKYLKKTECFCFRRQTLRSKAHMNMPLLFHMDVTLPKNIKVVTLAYTLFDVTNLKKNDKSSGLINEKHLGKIA